MQTIPIPLCKAILTALNETNALLRINQLPQEQQAISIGVFAPKQDNTSYGFRNAAIGNRGYSWQVSPKDTSQLDETIRHNKTQERLGWAGIKAKANGGGSGTNKDYLIALLNNNEKKKDNFEKYLESVEFLNLPENEKANIVLQNRKKLADEEAWILSEMGIRQNLNLPNIDKQPQQPQSKEKFEIDKIYVDPVTKVKAVYKGNGQWQGLSNNNLKVGVSSGRTNYD